MDLKLSEENSSKLEKRDFCLFENAGQLEQKLYTNINSSFNSINKIKMSM